MIPSKGPTFMSTASMLEAPARKVTARNPNIEPSPPTVASIAFAISVFIDVRNGNITTFSIGLLKDRHNTVKRVIVIAAMIMRRRSSSRCSQKVIATSLDSLDSIVRTAREVLIA